MGVVEAEDNKRKYITRAKEASQKYLSLRTGMIHCNDLHSLQTLKEAVPLLENFAYILALFRSKQGDCLHQAQMLLSRLLHFQVPKIEPHYGGIPVYLHDFPHVYDLRTSIETLYIFYWIEKEFYLILEKDLKRRFDVAVYALFDFCDRNIRIKSQPFSLLFLWECLEHAYIERKIPSFPDSPCSSAHAADLMLGLIVLGNKNPKEADIFLQTLYERWYDELGVYLDAPFDEHMYGHQNEIHLTDYIYQWAFEQDLQRLKQPHPVEIKLSMIYPLTLPLKRPNSSYDTQRGPYQIAVIKGCAIEVLNTPQELIKETSGQHSLRILFGTLEKNFSFVCQQMKGFQGTVSKQSIEMIFHYPEELLLIQGEEQLIDFYLSWDKDIELFVEKQKSSIFRLHETLSIVCMDQVFQMTFQIQEGEGDFVGQISMGPRPCQRLKDIVDWKISIRTLRRSPVFILRIDMQIL